MILTEADLPLLVFAVIFAVPGLMPRTVPLLLTEATKGLLDEKTTDLLVALDGETVAVTTVEEPAVIVVDFAETVTF